jgi:hAT family C-terminal dimerisation region
MELYNSELTAPRDACPLEWWKGNAIRFKTLAVMARVFLCVPAT